MSDLEQNKRLMQHVYAELSRRNSQPLLDSMADDVRWTIIGTTRFSGIYVGKQDIADRFLKPFGAALGAPVVFTVERLIAEGEYVVMLLRGQGSSAQGKPYNNSYCIVARIAGGKIKEMTDYIDTELITATFGK